MRRRRSALSRNRPGGATSTSSLRSLSTEILANPNTPHAVLAKHYDDTHYRAEWGLALNPKTPPAVMERLARSSNLHARINLVLYNRATPRAIIERLAKDPDD